MQEGIEAHEGKVSYNVATAEKALIDTLHISTRKGKRFSDFPELDLDLIDHKKLHSLLTRLRMETRQRVLARWSHLLQKHKP